MRRRILLCSTAVALTAAGCSTPSPTVPGALGAVGGSTAVLVSSAQEQGGRGFVVELSGANEAPGPGDPDGSGTAELSINAGQEEVCFSLSVTNIALPATGAHIHRAPAGQPGPVVVPLTPPASGTSSGCRPASRELLIDILTNPEGYYVNVHNAQFPAGAVRGQLTTSGK